MPGYSDAPDECKAALDNLKRHIEDCDDKQINNVVTACQDVDEPTKSVMKSFTCDKAEEYMI